MSPLPSAPYFMFWEREHFIELHETVETRRRTTRLALLRKNSSNEIAYCADGTAWRISVQWPDIRFNLLDRLLVHTFYNPWHDVDVSWSEPHNYPFEKLRDVYRDAVEHDDDILTQFVEQEELLVRISRSLTFQDFVDTARWMNTDHYSQP